MSDLILPTVTIPNRANQYLEYTGIDSIEYCKNKRLFREYPHHVDYCFNSRGFRDAEWPEDLANSIWCVGDSFTVGLGSPIEHIWPQQLQNLTGIRTINVSLDGASNTWMSRQAVEILKTIKPRAMVIHWSYISRRERDAIEAVEEEWQRLYSQIKDSSWPDCTWLNSASLPEHILNEINEQHGGVPVMSDDQRILYTINCSEEEDLEDTLSCIGRVRQCSGSTTIIHSFIPDFSPKKFKGFIEPMIPGLVIPEIVPLDLARDGHHYDIKTSQQFCQQIVNLLNQ